MCSWTHNKYNLLSVIMQDCLLPCCSLSVLSIGVYSTNHTLLQHSNYNIDIKYIWSTRTLTAGEPKPILTSLKDQSTEDRRKDNLDIQCLKTRDSHSWIYGVPYNKEWADKYRDGHTAVRLLFQFDYGLWSPCRNSCHNFINQFGPFENQSIVFFCTMHFKVSSMTEQTSHWKSPLAKLCFQWR